MMKKQLLKISFLLAMGAFGLHESNAQTLDSIAPVIKLNPGGDNVELSCNNTPYIDPGATAVDERAPFNLTSSIVVTGFVNTRRPGKYFLYYTVQDVHGNKAFAVRTVNVFTTKKHGFDKVKLSDNLDLYLTGDAYEIVRTSYQWYIDGVKYGDKNSPDSLYVFSDSIPKKITMQEWFCGEDTAINHELDNGKPLISSYIKGLVNVDYNQNCQLDQGEKNAEMKINLLNSASQIISTTNSLSGQFAFYHLDSGRYTVQAFTPGNSQALICNPKEVVINVVPHTISDGTVFNVQCASYRDVSVKSILAIGSVPGRIMYLKPNIGLDNFYKQLTCDTGKISGTVSISVKGKTQYLKPGYGALKPDKINNKVFTYDIADFNQIRPNAFDLNFLMDTNAIMTDKIEVEVYVSNIKIDVDTTNNRYKSEIPVRTSYDPNLVVLDPHIVEPNFSGTVVHTIHFQNTGNAEAYNIRVLDTLDAEFDPSSFELLANSHPVRYSIKGHALNFYFPDILLADSSSNEAASHGYVTFRVKPKQALVKDETLFNTAHIYFDYNTPVSTNTADLSVQEKQSTGVLTGIQNDRLKVYPNPANGSVQIDYNIVNGNAQMDIFNAQGVCLDSISLQNGKTVYNTQKLSSGMYVLRISENGRYTYKWIQVIH